MFFFCALHKGTKRFLITVSIESEKLIPFIWIDYGCPVRVTSNVKCYEFCDENEEFFLTCKYSKLFLSLFLQALEYDREGLMKLKKAVKAIYNSGNSKLKNRRLSISQTIK